LTKKGDNSILSIEEISHFIRLYAVKLNCRLLQEVCGMKDEYKTKEQLIAELEASEAERKRAEEALR